jgi:hypothetical protein
MRVQRGVFRSLAVVSVITLGSVRCGSGGEAGPSAPAGGEDALSNGVVPGGEASPSGEGSAPDGNAAAGASAESDGTAMPDGMSPIDGAAAGTDAEGVPTVNGGITPTEPAAAAEGSAGTGMPAEETGATGPGVGSTFHVFLLLGQSNMAGYPKAQEADRAEDPRVRVLGFDDCGATGRQIDVWDVAAPPLHECWNDGLGPGDYFAKTLVDVIPEGDTIGLVPAAISGERIEPFLKVGGTRYDRLIQRARLAQEAGGVIEGILFHQGESNSGDPSWPGKVNTLVTDLRTDLGLGNVPFLAGELLYTGGTAGHNVRVNELPALVSNAFVISANGLVVDPTDTEWNLHFGHDSQVELGRRYAAKMIEALGW